MANKAKLQYHCQQCGAQSAKWAGQCGQCEQWNCIEAVTINAYQGFAKRSSSIQQLSDVTMDSQKRLSTNLTELDRVLGGGLMAGMVVLIGGEPGIGKSTLLLQMCAKLAKSERVLYVSGEESLPQIASRAHRLHVDNQKDIHLLAETSVTELCSQAEVLTPQLVVVDSIQTMHSDAVPGAPGTVSQIRETASQLVQWAKHKGIMLFIVGHVTKEGALAGPKLLEHMVDTVLYFEGADDSRYRLLRAMKNRYGSVNELGVFAMLQDGLHSVSNPSAIFIRKPEKPTSGSIVTVAWEGSRGLLVEVQTLVDDSQSQNPRRLALGYDHQRLSLLLAILHKHAHVPFFDKDIFVNIVGGVRINETSADLALMFALLSSLHNRALALDTVVLGEVGLTGEIRPVPLGQERLQAAKLHGFKRAVVPSLNVSKQPVGDLKIIGVSHVSDALACFQEL